MNCCIGLCVWNSEEGLPYVFRNIEKIQTLFETTRVVIFYDNSNDNSLQIIKNEIMQNKINIHLIENPVRDHTNFRTINIAIARNGILQYIRENFSDDLDYMIMMDTNNYACVGEIQLNVIQSVLNRQEEWDAISFDKLNDYYDFWALSYDPFIYSFFHFQNFQHVVGLMREQFKKILLDYQTHKPEEYIPVYSAYNGMAIYKWNVFMNCEYSDKINTSFFPESVIFKQIEYTKTNIRDSFTQDCEHRHFHLQAVNTKNAKIRICTKSAFLPRNK